MNNDIEVLGVFRIHLLLRHFITSELLVDFFFFYFACQDFYWEGPAPPSLFYTMLNPFLFEKDVPYMFLNLNHFLFLAKNNYTF